jgi:AcrR family transcriptional regulator
MKATFEIIAARGLEGLVIQDITEAADVGYGSFYNHFTSKEAIVAAVIEAARLHGLEMRRAILAATSVPVEAFALELLAFLRIGKTDRTLGWFLVRTLLSGEGHRSWIAAELTSGLNACFEAGIFRSDVEMAYEMTSGSLLIGMLNLLRDDMPEDYPEKLVATVLRYLGVPAPKIKAILSKPFLDFAPGLFLEPSS